MLNLEEAKPSKFTIFSSVKQDKIFFFNNREKINIPIAFDNITNQKIEVGLLDYDPVICVIPIEGLEINSTLITNVKKGIDPEDFYLKFSKNIVFTIGVNPVNSSYFGKKIKENLIASDFVISLDLFVNETTELADMILPTTSLGEKEGTVTNMEMRVMKQNKILPAPGSTLSEWEYLTSLLKVLGADVNYKNENEINNFLSKQYKD